VIVLGPLLSHPGEVGAIFFAVMGMGAAPPEAVPYPLLLVSSWLLVGSIVFALTLDRRAGLELAALGAAAFVLPPLVFFTAYFTLLHSPRHLLRHRRLVAGGPARLITLGYTAIAVTLVIALTALLPGGPIALQEELVRGLFIGLAALTIPHMVLIDGHVALQKLFRTESHVTGQHSGKLERISGQ
jgi:Brp/Blh family beta-carotene 15,15'-monooxygenase